MLESHEGRSLLQTIPVIMIIVGRRPDSVARCIDLGRRMSYLLEPISHEMLDLRIHITMQKHANREEQALHIKRIEKLAANMEKRESCRWRIALSTRRISTS